MYKKILKTVKKAISAVVAISIIATTIPSWNVSGEEVESSFPYVMFASAYTEGAITINAGNCCINGNIATNGTIVSTGNMNVNGSKTENADESMIYISEKINTEYFEGENIQEYSQNYTSEEINININIPTRVDGEVMLDGNVNINTALKATEDICLYGEVKNTNDSIIFSGNGDIVIDSTNVNLNGLIYAPFGDVIVTSQNLNLNNVIIIAETITLNCPNVNANYSANMGLFVGNISEEIKDSEQGSDEDVEQDSSEGSGEDSSGELEEDFNYTVDTDSDGLCDGDEIYLGTDPTNSDSDGNGILDGDEKFFQTYVHEVANSECEIEEVIVSMTTSGNILNTTEIRSVMNSDILCSEVAGLIGEPFSIETESLFDNATLSFKIDQSKLGDTEFDSLLVLWYDEANQQFVELETSHDYENSIVSVETTHFSRYMVVDSYKWFEAWSEEFDFNPNNIKNKLFYNTVLTIDCSSSMNDVDPIEFRTDISSAEDSQFSKTCKRITAVNSFISTMETGDKAAVVFFSNDGDTILPFTDDKNEIRLAMQKLSDDGGTSLDEALYEAIDSFDNDSVGSAVTGNRIFLFSDGGSIVSYTVLSYARVKGIKIFTFGFGEDDEVMQRIADYTYGQYFQTFTSEDIINIYREDGIDIAEFDTTDTDEDGLYDAVEAAGIRVQNGTVIYNCDPTNPDSDGDGLLDGEEINPEVKRKLNSSTGKMECYFVMNSNPLGVDCDYDGIEDDQDLNPVDNTFSGEMMAHGYTFDVNFNVDYREFFENNEQYNKKLAILGSLYATLAYSTGEAQISLDNGAVYNGEDKRVDGLFELFGLTDVVNYRISRDYLLEKVQSGEMLPDDDISEMFIGHRPVTVNGETKEVIMVSVRGTDSTIEEWSSNFDIGADTEDYWDRDNPEWLNKENHKGFDVAANRLYNYILSYVDTNVTSNSDKVIYIVGHSRGAAISNILGARFEDSADYETFVYTFASPATTTDPDYKSYKTIFNIINNDDMITHLPLEEWGFNRYGTQVSLSIEQEYEDKNSLNGNYKYSWEWMFGEDYNYNGNLFATKDAFAEIVDSREDFYRYYDTEDTFYGYKASEFTDIELAAQDRLDKYGERIGKYCRVTAKWYSSPGEEFIIVSVQQTPAFLAMVLTDVVAKRCHNYDGGTDTIELYTMRGKGEDTYAGKGVGFFVSQKFSDAKDEFIWSCAEVTSEEAEFVNMGGMTHSHMQGTYYFMTCDFRGIWKF